MDKTPCSTTGEQDTKPSVARFGEWQPIETAPKDGTRVLVSDGKLFAAAYWHIEIEPAETCLGYGEGLVHEVGPFAGSPRIGPRFAERIPNPKAGQISWQGWMWDNPSAFRSEDEVAPDYDGHLEHGHAAYWMPLLTPPPTVLRTPSEVPNTDTSPNTNTAAAPEPGR